MHFYLWLSIFWVALFQPQTPAKTYFYSYDLSDDGRFLAALTDQGLALLRTSDRSVIYQQPFPTNSHMSNLTLSGNGKHIFFGNNLQLYYAKVSSEGITTPILVPLQGGVWLDLDTNFDGTTTTATVDLPTYYVNDQQSCSPGKRVVAVIRRVGLKLDVQYLGATLKNCEFINRASPLPDGGVVYGLQGNPTKEEGQNGIFEAIPDGESDWGQVRITRGAEGLPPSPASRSGQFLTYLFASDHCDLFIYQKDKTGVWSKEKVRPTKDNECGGAWSTAISPDGNKVVFLNYKFDPRRQGFNCDAFYLSTRNKDGSWSSPIFLTSVQHLGQQFPLIRLSNTNFAFSDYGGNTWLFNKLGEAGKLVQW